MTLTKTVSVTPNVTTAGYITAGTAGNSSVSLTASVTTKAAATITPSGSEQTAVAANVYTTGVIKVAAIPSDYVGSGITARSSSDLTVSGATVTAPAGYYASDASKSVDSGSLSAGNGSVNVTATGITLQGSTTQPTSGIFLTATGAGTVSVGTAGYLAANTSKTSKTATLYYKITGSTVTSSQSLPSGSSAAGTAGYGTYAKVSAGYYASDRYIGSGISAGTIATPTGKSATATVTALKYTYNSTNDNFTVAHNTQASATVSVTPSVTTAGYVSSSVGTKTANNVTAYGQVNATLAKIAGSVSISGTKTYKPSITRSAFTISGVTDGASGAATTTAPSSGVYVKVSSAANTGNVTGAATISTAGYGTSSYHGIAGSGNVAVGAAASDATYVPIKTATPAFKGGAVSGSVTGITGSNVTLSDTNNGIAVTAAASAGRAVVQYNGAVNGYVVKANNDTALAATTSNTTLTGKTRYITGITVPTDVPFTLYTENDIALDNTSTTIIDNGAYRNIDISNSDVGGYVYLANASGSSSSIGAEVVNGPGGYIDVFNSGIIRSLQNDETISDFENSGTINILSNYSGGVIADLYNSNTITRLTNGEGTISQLYNNEDGTIGLIDNDGTITSMSNRGTIQSLSNYNTGVIDIDNGGSVSVAGSGNTYFNNYNSGSLYVSGSNVAIISNGNWTTYTVTPSTSAQGPYYGKTTVNAISPSNTLGTTANDIGKNANGIFVHFPYGY